MFAACVSIHPRRTLVALGLLATVVFTGAACKKSGIISPSASLKGDVVVVRFHAAKGQTVRVGGQERKIEDYGEAVFYFAADKFEPGRNEIVISVTEDGKTSEEKVAFMVPNGVGEPFLRLHACKHTEGGTPSTAIQSGFGRINSCQADDAEFNYSVHATTNPEARVTIGGKKVEADADGNLVLPIDAASVALNSPVEITSDGPPFVAIPVQIKYDKKTLKGDIAIKADGKSLLEGLLKSFSPGKPLTEGLAPEGKGVAIYREKSDYSSLIVGGPGKLKDVRLIAFGVRQPGRSAGSCGPYESVDGKGGGFSKARTEIDVEVSVYDSTNGAELAKKVISAANGDCPSYTTDRTSYVEVLPNDEIRQWLDSLLTTENAVKK